MTQYVMEELIDRVAAVNGAAVVINRLELAEWPDSIVTILQRQRLLTRTCPASRAVCTGCERECFMPVHIRTTSTGVPEAFIVCDKRSDINRVPVSPNLLEQWQTSGEAIAGLLTDLLGLQARPGDSSGNRWEIGLLKGVKHAAYVLLLAGDSLTLSLAGHSVALSEVLTADGDTIKVDRKRLRQLVDRPVAAAGDVESAAQRRDRLKKRIATLKAQGVRNFQQVVLEEEGISPTRLKQILKAC